MKKWRRWKKNLEILVIIVDAFFKMCVIWKESHQKDSAQSDSERVMHTSKENVLEAWKNSSNGTCADLAKHYNSRQCCISGETGIDKSKPH